ncbi:MAG: glycosyltransferase [Deltaproteobacteria bacterium]|nr:glycosyltransferase [Deltaproteobacteria bacterium]
MVSILFVGFYYLLFSILSIFGVHRYYLSYLYSKYKQNKPRARLFESLLSEEIPVVTVQLPIFNERYVAPRLLSAVSRLKYPRDKLEIQVLDDSTDETTSIARSLVDDLAQEGLDIVLIHREDRTGFKAGALNHGLKKAKGNFIAVFDADFVPEPDFLEKTVPHFLENPGIGMVQVRWEHLNKDFSLLTQTQSIFLDGHFMIEHTARNRSGRFFNFNGTAGVWRREAIQTAGGWQCDTLTEDLDLSYRAQLEGWQFLYLEDVVSPAELPVDINAFKTQQHRWAKGSIQTARKLLPRILRSSFSRKVKLEALFHLGANFAYLAMFVVSILLPFSLYVRHQLGWEGTFLLDIPFFLSATFSVVFFYLYSQREIYPDWVARIKYLPFNLALGIGLSVNNAKAVVEALLSREGEFSRTPKYAVVKKGDLWKNKKYKGKFDYVSFIELALGVHFTIAVIYSLVNDLYLSLPFLVLFQMGYLYTAFMSFHQSGRVPDFLPLFRLWVNHPSSETVSK